MMGALFVIFTAVIFAIEYGYYKTAVGLTFINLVLFMAIFISHVTDYVNISL